MSSINVCFVAHNAYGAVSGNTSGHIGGVERQTSMVSKLLAERGHKVTLITWNESNPDEEMIDGVRVVKLCRQADGLPGIRFFIPRWTSLISALTQADADVYYHNGAEYVTGQVALWCKQHNRKFIFSSASDKDADASLPGLTTLRERILYRYGIRTANKVLAQTEKQKADFLASFGVESDVMLMPCPGPSDNEYVQPVRNSDSLQVLWVGRIHPVKRLELLLDIAEALPKVNFHVAGGGDWDSDYVNPLLDRMDAIQNVNYHGKLGREDIQRLYQQCDILCCTSSMEGFPNTFLEAWSYGLPVVSTFDPDGLINKLSLGVGVTDMATLSQALVDLSTDHDRWLGMSQNARRHYVENYQVSTVIEKYERLFLNI